MADLNPSIPDLADRDAFNQSLAEAAGDLFHEGKEQGELYFYIPALGRRRGVAHFYLEEYRGISPGTDGAFAHCFGAKMIQCYGEILARSLSRGKPTPADERQQLEYHTLYFLQVLLLDRGTTSGLLVHQDNDLGILGSLPRLIDRELLTSWIPKHPALQQELINRINDALGAGQRVLIDAPLKLKIAQIVREFYGQHPEAQDLLAKGKVAAPTVSNHR
jgi:coproporphyrinogen III oxidase